MNDLTTAPSLQMADLSDFAGEPRVFDLRLAELLGYERPRDIRKIIRRNMAELEAHEQALHGGAEFAGQEEDGISLHGGAKIPTFIDDGISRHGGAKLPARGRGRPEEGFLLNEAQAILITMFSRTPTAAEVRRQIIAVFIAWRHGRLGIPAQLPASDADRAQDLRSTPQQRFMAECERLAAQNNTTVAELLHHIISPQQQRAIELGHGPIANLLHKDRRWEMFLCIGMDLQYVLHGVWGQTPQERWFIAQMRTAQAKHRLEALPQPVSISCEP